MVIIVRCTVVFMLALTLAACSKKLDDSSLPPDIKVGGIYYTQVTMRYEKGRFLTTNYRLGALIPVNTQVSLNSISSDTIELDILPELTPMRVINVEKHTGNNITQIFVKLFAKDRLDLSGFSKLEKDNIDAGHVAPGMRKKAVIAAIGYPPITETPTLQSNRWTYWSSRFNRFVVEFIGDRVTRVQG